ncbi:NUDIX domain-containing protein [Moraxella sp. ZY200743]|uniref:NUDIX domain-containing protein n=1 Tax=Moraxella sp. ZY200743 TaxID=2911970 RepID=UPI003D7D2501
MTNGSIQPALVENANKPTIEVAIAVLQYNAGEGKKYLLATRHAHQHQGGKLEFVGGKIEIGETAMTALVREVQEEIGLDITDNLITKMGRIYHDYASRSVCLHVYLVKMTKSQYDVCRHQSVGLDGQQLGFYDEGFVLSQSKRFPDANRAILMWLTLPEVLIVSHALTYFKQSNNKTDWLDCYKTLPKNSTLVVRSQAGVQIDDELIDVLKSVRKDLRFVVPFGTSHGMGGTTVLAHRLTQEQLMNLDLFYSSTLDLPNAPIIASCHDKQSLQKANALARVHPVLAVLLSPVKPTQSHPNEPALGWGDFWALAELSDVPVIALGGLLPDDLGDAWASGAVAVAGIRGFI